MMLIALVLTPTTVWAADGDFVTFRESTGDETIAQSPSISDMGWDTTVSNTSGTYTLQANTYDIRLGDTGHYLVLYSLPTYDPAGSNSERTDSIAWLELAGTDLAYGFSQGYIRRQTNNFEGYNAGAAIIDATAAQFLSVEMQRRDTNTDSVSRRPSKSGISILKLVDTWDYLRLRVATRSANISGNTSFVDVDWDTQDEVDTGSFAHDTGSSPDEITLSGAAGDHFLVTANVSLNQDANSSVRQNYEMRLALGGNEIDGTRVTTYIRGNPNSDGTYSGVLAYSGIITKQAATDEILTVQVRRESQGGANTDIVDGETAISIAKLPNTADYVRLAEVTGGQDLATTRSVVTWDSTIEEDATSFEHDGTNTSRVNIDQDGDYLFFSTMYAERGSTTDATRETQFLEWRLDGSTLLGYGNHGAFNRGDQSTTDSYTSGSSSGIVLDALTSSQYVELTQINEASNGTSTYVGGRMGLQGVNIDSLFASAADTRQLHYRWRDDTTDLNTAGGWLASENTDPATTAVPNDTYRLRLEVANIGGLTEAAARTYELQWGLKSEVGVCADISTWTGIGDNSDAFDMVASANITPDGESTTPALLANSEGYTYTTGQGRDTADTTSSIGPLLTQRYTELEYSFEATSYATPGATYCFRLYDTNNTTVLDAYNVYPSLTLAAPDVQQLHFRWRDDSADLNTSSGWLAVEDSNTIVDASRYTTYRLRFEIANVGEFTQVSSTSYEIQWGEKQLNQTCADISTWAGLEDSASDEFEMYLTDNITPDGETTTPSLLANGEAYSYVSGEGRESSDTTSAITALDTNEYTELEYSFQSTEYAVTGTSYCFRIYDSTNASTLDTYSVYPEITLESSSVYGELQMEWGTQEGVDDDSWTTINFDGNYTSPVFVCTVEYANNIGNESDGDTDSVVCRVQSVGSTSAQVRLQEPGAPGSLTDAETVHWFVVEEGAYDTGEIKLEAFTYTSTVTDSSSSWVGEVQSYTQSYTNPVVLGQVMTYNDSNYSVFWAHDGSRGAPTAANLYTGKHVAGDTTTTRSNETIGVVVIEQASSSLNGITYEARLQTQTIDRVDDIAPSTYTFNQAFSTTPQVGVVSQAGMSGSDGGHPVLYNNGSGALTTTNIYAVIMEDEIGDTEMGGNTEYAPYIVFETPGTTYYSLEQLTYRFYENADAVQPTTPLAAENAAITGISTADLARIRMAVQVGGGTLAAGSDAYTLQFGEGATCSAIVSWTDVDSASGSGIWRGYINATPADGATITSSLLNNQTNILQSYEEENDSATNPNSASAGQLSEWDWVIQNNGAKANTSYCFRMITDDDETLIYSTYPRITTSQVTYTQEDFEWYVEESSVTLTDIWPAAPGGVDLAENTVLTQMPSTNDALAIGDRIRIQINFSIAESPLGTNEQAFKLQYGEGEDCSAIGTWVDVGAKGSGEIWRLYDESSLADSETQVNQISTSDTGAEGGYTEITPSATNPNAVALGQQSEWDFPVENNGATDNTSYCFKMILADDSNFTAYTNYPRLYTHPGMAIVMRHGNFFRNDAEQGFVWAN